MSSERLCRETSRAVRCSSTSALATTLRCASHCGGCSGPGTAPELPILVSQTHHLLEANIVGYALDTRAFESPGLEDLERRGATGRHHQREARALGGAGGLDIRSHARGEQFKSKDLYIPSSRSTGESVATPELVMGSRMCLARDRMCNAGADVRSSLQKTISSEQREREDPVRLQSRDGRLLVCSKRGLGGEVAGIA